MHRHQQTNQSKNEWIECIPPKSRDLTARALPWNNLCPEDTKERRASPCGCAGIESPQCTASCVLTGTSLHSSGGMGDFHQVRTNMQDRAALHAAHGDLFQSTAGRIRGDVERVENRINGRQFVLLSLQLVITHTFFPWGACCNGHTLHISTLHGRQQDLLLFIISVRG